MYIHIYIYIYVCLFYYILFLFSYSRKAWKLQKILKKIFVGNWYKLWAKLCLFRQSRT